jgi:hypothetical protein
LSKTAPIVPNALAIADAMERSAPLALLRHRLKESARRFATVQPCLPDALKPHVTPGPVDDEGWTLFAANASVAAKLRHLQPAIETRLANQGYPKAAVRIKARSG